MQAKNAYPLFSGPAKWWGAAGALGVLASTAASIYFKTPVLAAGAFAVAFLLFTLTDYRTLFFLMAASLPVSVPLELSSGFSLELPSEPLMILLMGIFIIKVLSGGMYSGRDQWRPLHRWLIALLAWMAFTSLLSEFPDRSVKFMLAKLWFLIAFIYMGEKIIRTPADVRKLFWWVWLPMVSITLFIGVRHAMEGFSFEAAHNIPLPFYFNGVSFAATLVAFVPWVWVASTWYGYHRPEKWVLLGSLAFFVLMAVLTYKRLAWATLVLLPIFNFALNRRWIRPAALAAIVISFLGVLYLVQGNRFYSFAPDFKDTVWHGDDLSGHLEATVSGNEISGVERFYRWVAAKNMVAARPFTGFGPSTFNQVYKQYADDAFRTYVSDNPEQSTTHNYYLMTFAEQGVPGGLLIFLFCMWVLVYGEKQVHTARGTEWEWVARMGALSAFVVIFFCLLNELFELDEVGGLFFLSLLMIHVVSRQYENRSHSLPQ